MISREVITTGATTDEAIEKGCQELGLNLDEVKFEILELPKQKTLGLFGGSPATVRVYVERDPAKEAKEYLNSIIKAMGLDNIDIEIKYNEEGGGAELDLTGEGLGNVIGRHGETLSALQYLVSLSANNTGEEYYRITINIGNYREKHESSIENFARKTAQRALKLNTNLALEPMNPYERRIIHTAVQEIEGVSSWSVGEGASRHVVIGPEGVNEGEDGLPVNKSRGYGRGGYNNGYSGRGYGRGGYKNYGSGKGGYKNRRYSGVRNNRYRGYNNYGGYYNGNSGDGENSGYTRQGRYAGNHNYSTGYDSYNRDNGNNNGGYSRDEYGNGQYNGQYNSQYNDQYGQYNNQYKQYSDENGEKKRDDGYRRNNYYGGGYNRGGRRGYKNNGRYNDSYSENSSNNNYEKREVRKDSSAPLYGRIEVPKKSQEDEEE